MNSLWQLKKIITYETRDGRTFDDISKALSHDTSTALPAELARVIQTAHAATYGLVVSDDVASNVARLLIQEHERVRKLLDEWREGTTTLNECQTRNEVLSRMGVVGHA